MQKKKWKSAERISKALNRFLTLVSDIGKSSYFVRFATPVLSCFFIKVTIPGNSSRGKRAAAGGGIIIRREKILRFEGQNKLARSVLKLADAEDRGKMPGETAAGRRRR